jgi:hypothetical protein
LFGVNKKIPNFALTMRGFLRLKNEHFSAIETFLDTMAGLKAFCLAFSSENYKGVPKILKNATLRFF